MTKKIQSYTEAEMIGMFGLTRVVGNAAHALMTQWLTATASLSIGEQELFEIIFNDVQANIIRWQEEELKMLFISPLLILEATATRQSGLVPLARRIVWVWGSPFITGHLLAVVLFVMWFPVGFD